MLHPSYQELIDQINVVNTEKGLPEVNSRYSLIIACAKRARALVNGSKAQVPADHSARQLSTAVAEMNAGKIGIYTREAQAEEAVSAEYGNMSEVDFSESLQDEE